MGVVLSRLTLEKSMYTPVCGCDGASASLCVLLTGQLSPSVLASLNIYDLPVSEFSKL